MRKSLETIINAMVLKFDDMIRKASFVKTINNTPPDKSGNITIQTGGGFDGNSEDALELLAEMAIAEPITDETGAIVTDENGALYVY